MSPIRASERNRYPADWPAISLRIRTLAGHRCDCRGECGHDHGFEHHAVGDPDGLTRCTALNGQKHPITGSWVVLTVAHLDHQPENCDDANLRAMCQRCHLAYDREHHAETRAATRLQTLEDAGQLAIGEPS